MKDAVIEKFAALTTAAFGFVAALAWNSAIQAFFSKFFGEAHTLLALMSYAVIITIVAVVATAMISKAAEKAKAKEATEK